MKLLQLNCWGGKLGTQLQRLIAEEKPDIVCLQEANDISDRPGSILSSFRYFLSESSYPHYLLTPMFSMQYMHEMVNLGVVIASKMPFSKTHQQFVLGEFKEDIETLKDDYNLRNFSHVVIDTPQGKINVLTHHGHHSPNGKDGSDENTRQMQIIADYISSLDGPVIFTGDLNLHPGSPSLKPVHDVLIDLPSKYKMTTTRNELAKRVEVIDYIFVSKDIKINDFYASSRIVSDHQALVLDFNL